MAGVPQQNFRFLIILGVLSWACLAGLLLLLLLGGHWISVASCLSVAVWSSAP